MTIVKPGRAGRRGLLAILLSLVMVSGFAHPAAANVGAGTASQTASASDVALRGCQNSYFILYLNTKPLTARSWNCSGTYTVNRTALGFMAEGWSGIVHYGTTQTFAFCDHESWDLWGYYVRKVELRATRAPWC